MSAETSTLDALLADMDSPDTRLVLSDLLEITFPDTRILERKLLRSGLPVKANSSNAITPSLQITMDAPKTWWRVTWGEIAFWMPIAVCESFTWDDVLKDVWLHEPTFRANIKRLGLKLHEQARLMDMLLAEIGAATSGPVLLREGEQFVWPEHGYATPDGARWPLFIRHPPPRPRYRPAALPLP